MPFVSDAVIIGKPYVFGRCDISLASFGELLVRLERRGGVSFVLVWEDKVGRAMRKMEGVGAKGDWYGRKCVKNRR